MVDVIPIPSLKSVDKLLKNKKDPDFLQLFDSTQTQYYSNLRHKYDVLYENSRKEFEHLRLFTKHLRKIIEKNKNHYEQLKDDFLEYRRDEPTLQPIRHSVTNTRTEDEISLHLPIDFDDGRAVSPNSGPQGKKMTEECMADVYNYDWKLTNLGSMFYNRLEQEVSNPLYEFRKQYQQKLHKVHEYTAQQYDKMVKHGMAMREKQVNSNEAWNELCDCRARLDKAIKNKKENKVTKHNSRVQSAIKKVKKMFEDVVKQVDEYNTLQEQFWNISLVESVNQLEAMNHSRCAFLQEYMTKYLELLNWKRAEERNGEEEIQVAIKSLMTPNDCVRISSNQASFDHGNYQSHAITDYQIPCMPNEVATVGPPLSQQRIDPTVILPIYDPFGDELNNATSGGKRMSSVRSVSSVRNKNKNANAASVLTSQRSSFFADNTAKLFARTVNSAAHRMSASAVSPNSANSSGSASTSPKNSSLALLQSVSRTSSLDVDDAKEDHRNNNNNNNNNIYNYPNGPPPPLRSNKSVENVSNNNIQHTNPGLTHSASTTPVGGDNNENSYSFKNRRPPLPPRSNSARFGKNPNNNNNSTNNNSNIGFTANVGNGTKPALPSRPLPTTPQRGRRGGMQATPPPNENKDNDSSSDDESDNNDNNNSGNNSANNSNSNIETRNVSYSVGRKLPPRPGGKPPPLPPNKDAKTVASFVVRKATLESQNATNAPPLPPRSSRPQWKMTMN